LPGGVPSSLCVQLPSSSTPRPEPFPGSGQGCADPLSVLDKFHQPLMRDRIKISRMSTSEHPSHCVSVLLPTVKRIQRKMRTAAQVEIRTKTPGTPSSQITEKFEPLTLSTILSSAQVFPILSGVRLLWYVYRRTGAARYAPLPSLSDRSSKFAQFLS